MCELEASNNTERSNKIKTLIFSHSLTTLKSNARFFWKNSCSRLSACVSLMTWRVVTIKWLLIGQLSEILNSYWLKLFGSGSDGVSLGLRQ